MVVSKSDNLDPANYVTILFDDVVAFKLIGYNRCRSLFSIDGEVRKVILVFDDARPVFQLPGLSRPDAH